MYLLYMYVAMYAYLIIIVNLFTVVKNLSQWFIRVYISVLISVSRCLFQCIRTLSSYVCNFTATSMNVCICTVSGTYELPKVVKEHETPFHDNSDYITTFEI